MQNRILLAQAGSELIDNPSGHQDLWFIFGLAIKYLLYGAGIIAIAFMIIGGYLYITSAGNAEAAGKAKNTMFYAILGLIISLAAVYIVEYLFATSLGISNLHL